MYSVCHKTNIIVANFSSLGATTLNRNSVPGTVGANLCPLPLLHPIELSLIVNAVDDFVLESSAD